MGFNLITLDPYERLFIFFVGSNLEKYGKFWQIWPDWGNTAWADMAGLGSIGLKN